MKRHIDLWQEAGHILESVGKGILLTAAAEGSVNTMTIGWGTLGIQWGKPIFIAFVRESRFTKALLDKNPAFTINIPVGEYDPSILKICGTKSGRDVDKFRELGLTPEEPETITVPGIRQFPLTLECKVIYKQAQDPDAIHPDNIERYYQRADQKGDYHTAYYGQITAAYVIE